MFGLFGSNKVQFVGLKGAMLSVRSAKKSHKLGKTQKFVLLVPVDGKVEKINVEMIVDACRPLPSEQGGSVVSGRLLVDEAQLGSLTSILTHVEPVDLGRAARRSRRVEKSLRVLSQEIPGFRGVTVDVSLHGLQLKLEGSMEAGQYLNIQLELEKPDLPQLTLQGVVVWCRQVGRRKAYCIGVEFTQQHPEVEQLWAAVYQEILESSSGSVMQRSIAGGDVYNSPDEEQQQ